MCKAVIFITSLSLHNYPVRQIQRKDERGEVTYLMIHLENGKSKTKTQVSDTLKLVSLTPCSFVHSQITLKIL